MFLSQFSLHKPRGPLHWAYAARNLNPGGYIEIQDIVCKMCSDDGSLPEDSDLKRWADLLNEGFRGKGRPMDSALQYPEQLAAAGFVDIGIVKEKWPTNRWPKDKKYKQIGRCPFSPGLSPQPFHL